MTPEEQLELVRSPYVLNGAGDAVPIVRLHPMATTSETTVPSSWSRSPSPATTARPIQVAEVSRFRGNRICEIRPFYLDPTPMVDAIARKAAATSRETQADGDFHE